LPALLLLAISSWLPGAADPFESAAAELARRIVAVAGPLEEVALSVRNASRLAAPEVERCARLLERELTRAGARLAAGSTGPVRVTATFSENVESWIWVAEVARGDARDVVMAVEARPPGRSSPEARFEPVLESRLLLEQAEPILDVLPLGGDVLVLDTRALSMVRSTGAIESVPLVQAARSGRWPRDPRGLLATGGDGFRAFIPAAVCEVAVAPALRVQCGPSDAAWPIDPDGARPAPGRNYFARPPYPPFYASAPAGDDDGRAWLLTGLDGPARLYDRDGRALASLPGWGSEAASLETSCRRLLLGVRPGAQPDTEAVRAYELVRRQVVPVGPPLELPGVVTALWGSQDRGPARVIVYNGKTGRYAAFLLSLACRS